MANEFKQRMSDAQNLVTTLNEIIAALDEGKDITYLNVQRVGGSDVMLIIWREGGGE